MLNQASFKEIKIPVLRIIPLSTASAVWNMALMIDATQRSSRIKILSMAKTDSFSWRGIILKMGIFISLKLA